MALSEKVIRYAVKEFEVAIREMSRNNSVCHTFRLTDGPPAWNLLILAGPSDAIDAMFDASEKAFLAAIENGPAPARN